MTGLHIAANFDLPLDAATRRMAALATSGAGKSNTCVVIAEQMYDAHIPWYVVDPKGDWWGVRSSRDGKHAGLSVPIFGGLHGDLPLEPTAGRVIAETIARQRLTCVLDVSQFDSAQQRYGFLADFAETLLRRNVEPLHGFLDECHQYIPQTPRDKGLQLRCLGAWEKLITGGRNKGLGTTQISQRSALVNKNTLDIVEAMIAMRTFSPRDRDAIEGWLGSRADKVRTAEILDSLPILKDGEAWFYAPEWMPGAPRRIHFERRRTFDSAATPKVGKSVTPPSTLADVDLAALGERMAATVERQKAEDPKLLRAKIAQLERTIASSNVQADAQVTAAYETQAADLRRQRADLEAENDMLRSTTAAYRLTLELAVSTICDRVAGELQTLARNLGETLATQPIVPTRQPAPVQAPQAGTAGGDRSSRSAASRRPPAAASPAASPAPPFDGALGEGERKVLGVLSEYPDGRTHNELAFLAGYSSKASTVGVILAKLRRLRLVEPGRPIRATAAGLDVAGGAPQRPTGQALLDHWLKHPRMGEGERKVLIALVERYPDALTKHELADMTGYSVTASTIGVCLSKLRKLGLVERGQRRAMPEFMESIGGPQ